MAILNTKIKLYLEANSKVYKDEKINFELQDDYVNNVSSPYIKTWNVFDLTEPTAEQIASYETAGNTAETLNDVLNTRRKEYPELKEQMDMQYKDLLNGTTTWKDAVAKVKSDNPKE